ncbi:hypothetical protein CCACVL1_21213 [Corchorus capsularis]|uniref:Uncharacterized protein n=1 Tax=Corchorus capsularis TaxID=210143 RepID=A0A1R3H7V3_COCAP|nr:hypothetical protein CCACVL1_21213 [Corchorus capsularis]
MGLLPPSTDMSWRGLLYKHHPAGQQLPTITVNG